MFQGDSGGPLVVFEPSGRYVQAGRFKKVSISKISE